MAASGTRKRPLSPEPGNRLAGGRGLFGDAKMTTALPDMACDAKAFRAAAREMGAIPVVPSRKGTKQPEPCPAFVYRHRNLIERCWAHLKERRAIATRYDKTATSYAAGIAIAATLDWFKSSR